MSARRSWLVGAALAICAGCASGPQRAPGNWSAAEEGFLRLKIRQQGGQAVILAGGTAIPASPWLSGFYARRGDHLAWGGASGPLPRVYELLGALRQAEGDGLPAAAYRLEAIEAAMSPWRRGAVLPSRRALAGLVELDLLLTNAFLLYADHLRGGRVPPQRRDWPEEDSADPAALLDSALADGRVGQALEELRPAHPQYALLRRALAEYRRRAAAGTDSAAALQERIAQLELNLERWRWLPRGKGARYLLVRLDAFELDLVEEGWVVLDMKIVAGKDQWRTPLFTSPLSQVVFNPYWNVPPSIAAEEILPALKEDPAYLQEKGLQVVKGQGDAARIIEADTLDWAAIPPDSLPYTFIQRPGPENPLGRMKFSLPNEFNIYLHDTPNRELFSRAVRNFSHGCIRLERAVELAVRLLEADPQWSRSHIRELIQAGQTRQVTLPRPIPVYFSYWTAWADEGGQVAFRPDLYGSDQRLREALGNGQELP